MKYTIRNFKYTYVQIGVCLFVSLLSLYGGCVHFLPDISSNFNISTLIIFVCFIIIKYILSNHSVLVEKTVRVCIVNI